jgi:basic membrane protein A
LLALTRSPGARPNVLPSPTHTTPCSPEFRVGVVTDITGLHGTVDAAGWAGLQRAQRTTACLQAELITTPDPTRYQAELERAADQHSDLVIAGSFLLTDAVQIAAHDRPSTRFVLVDPLVIPPAQPNLAVLSFREDQAGFLAGALAAMVTKTNVLAGVYALESAAVGRYRQGFEQGARFVNPSVRLLGVYQGAQDGVPFGNPVWGAAQARRFLDQGADVVFAAGGSTGQGALLATAQAGRLCIGADVDESITDPAAAPCLLTSAVTHVDEAVQTAVVDALAGRWAGGQRVFGLADGGVGLAPFHQFETLVTPAMRQRLAEIATRLASGTLLEKN